MKNTEGMSGQNVYCSPYTFKIIKQHQFEEDRTKIPD